MADHKISCPQPYTPPSYIMDFPLKRQTEAQDEAHINIEYILYRYGSGDPDARRCEQPKGCSITINTRKTTFEEFKSVVISRIGQEHSHFHKRIHADLASSQPQLHWSLKIENNEASLFRKYTAMPTTDPALFKQWAWGLRITTRGKGTVMVGQDRPSQEPALVHNLAASMDQIDSPIRPNLENRPTIKEPQRTGTWPNPPVPINDFFDYCHISPAVIDACLGHVLIEQHIDRYELFESAIVLSQLQNPRYAIPSGLIAILSLNVPAYRKYLDEQTY
ncbi:hypothetical protein PGT21_037070 [Puccinia graminis f. sp. tritici]|uniref:Uncharacterized protein n=2 Tax=Puccinia graminis f. sp. tritici TaxID=56615 RepID=E3KIH8_PUCGT|nr:uncharacterized protein PGTG_10481 [Puccinia graminis f. sp. tritici CRL 75-36-700-3]EFP84103.1 hypothetical protein PGTG_10481 [Puccinia graminis f. sp. tritici CRL 75-36-700-3]KAA1087504.1 hypothetical protein PGT21_032725 [Puccinia graminis f. sp. tritici]KAA1120050.1 hypothetical protein PGT21_037070 [Puccinia graminis f. sp. tritici]